MTPSPDARVVRWSPRGGPPRRLVFEPIGGDEFERIEYVWGGCGYWRKVGSEIVSDVAINGPRSAVVSDPGPDGRDLFFAVGCVFPKSERGDGGDRLKRSRSRCVLGRCSGQGRERSESLVQHWTFVEGDDVAQGSTVDNGPPRPVSSYPTRVDPIPTVG